MREMQLWENLSPDIFQHAVEDVRSPRLILRQPTGGARGSRVNDLGWKITDKNNDCSGHSITSGHYQETEADQWNRPRCPATGAERACDHAYTGQAREIYARPWGLLVAFCPALAQDRPPATLPHQRRGSGPCPLCRHSPYPCNSERLNDGDEQEARRGTGGPGGA
jgi:hypothetical protein